MTVKPPTPASTHAPGCECLEFGCTPGIRSHGCTCPFHWDTPVPVARNTDAGRA